DVVGHSVPRNDVRRDDALAKAEYVWIVAAHERLHPVMARRAEGLDAREGLERRRARAAATGAAAERLVDAEVVAVAMHEHHGLAIGARFLLERGAQLRVAVRLLRLAAGERREVGKDVRLLDDHDGAA